MFRNLTLAAKLLVTILPLIAAGFIITALDDHYQRLDMLTEAKSSAENYASIIRESLVNMMLSNKKVDDAYLDRLNTLRDIKYLHIHFTPRSLALRDTFMTDTGRVARLTRREEQNKHLTAEEREVFNTGVASERLDPAGFHMVIPFAATLRCRQCHDAPPGRVLGLADMEISLSRIEAASHKNVARSIAITLFFTGVAIIISILAYRKLVSKRLKRLVEATHVIGGGELDRAIEIADGNDELGDLGREFEGMRIRLRAIRQKLLQAERMSMVGQMASTIIHDFRTPMSTINLAIQSLEEGQELEPGRTQSWYRLIRESVRRMIVMAQELLDFSKGEMPLHKQTFSVEEFNRILLEGVRPGLERTGIRIIEEERYKGTAVFDPERMHRAVMNVINNAQDAMPQGGTLTYISEKQNGSVVFTVSDTGQGIPDAIRNTMFDLFVSSGKPRGTGLGLTITKMIVDQHGGSIEVESEKGKGATFRIRIPE